MSTIIDNAYPREQLPPWARPPPEPAAVQKAKSASKSKARTPRRGLPIGSVYGRPRPSLAARPRTVGKGAKEVSAGGAAFTVEACNDYLRCLTRSRREDRAVIKWLADVAVREADPPIHFPVIWKAPDPSEDDSEIDDVEPSVPGYKRKRPDEEERGYFSFDESDLDSVIEMPRPMKRTRASTPPRMAMASNSAATTPTSQRSLSPTYVQNSSGTRGERSPSLEKSV